TGEALLTFAVGVENGLIGVRCAVGHPGEQRGADVEADPRIVVNDACNAVVRSQDAGSSVGSVTLGGDALIPVMIRIGGFLELDGLEPGIFPGRLIKMTMNTRIAV